MRKPLLLMALWVVFGVLSQSCSQESKPELTLQELYDQHPGKVESLFASLDLNHPGLETVKRQVDNDQYVEACETLVQYYRNAGTADWLRQPPPEQTGQKDSTGEAIMNDKFVFQSVEGKQPRTPEGGLDWKHLGPNDDKEWGYFLNRHGILSRLMAAYRETGNDRYVRHFDRLVRDWVLNNPPPEEEVSSVTWRQLEVGLRMAGSWPKTFFGLIHSESFSPAGVILMLSAIPPQAEYIKDYHVIHHNWAAMEVNGLVSAALCWPEFKNSGQWYDHSMEAMAEEVDWEVYPDGVQKELTSHYHNVALRNFDEFVKILRKAEKTAPDSFLTVIEDMQNYLAYSMRPDGYGLLNNDSDRDFNRPQIEQAAEEYDRADWQYIISHGREGTRPETGPSVYFPWAGHTIFRNGWGENDWWGFFDGGPWGISHQHNDRLHLSIHAFGRDLLVDGGRYWYKGGDWREYFVTSPSHNVVLVDSMGQNAQKELSEQPITEHISLQDNMDFVMATYDRGFGDNRDIEEAPELPGSHTRAVVFLKNMGWLVFDNLEVDGSHEITPLWHFNPDCNVNAEGNTFYSDDPDKGNLQITPIAGFNWETATIQGAENPIQGWYSRKYNNKTPNTCVQYRATMEDDAAFAWFIQPYQGTRSSLSGKILKQHAGFMEVQVWINGEDQGTIAVRFAGDQPVQLNNGYWLDGDCAVMMEGQSPRVANGTLLGQNKEVMVRDD